MVLALETRKFYCQECQRYFWQRFPGILPRKRSTEPFRRYICLKHFDGICRSRLGRREGIGSATVERWFHDFLKLRAGERRRVCPQVLGIDEHFFSRRHGYATTLCDLKNHSVYDVVLGRSEASLESYLLSLEGKELVRVVCMDLASVYRAIVHKHFPNARIVADRFHVIRLIHHHFLSCWRDLDGVGSKNRGLLSLMRRHRHNLRPEQPDPLGVLSANTAPVGADLPFQTTALLSPAEQTPHPQTVPEPNPQAAPRHLSAPSGRTRSTGSARSNPP